ncbi:unnamed protein product (macronuclear) [Paramecium tetraurelia]|uniref:Uncharacterized protein n=1 Tax=Paramecium tetraurelia TaxID=5888 RepID=A0EI93_PARTE|nr:uncharacterized protein GSPATT00027363001 [Paramecium tetraurelia]CAK95034.1 unnamed protein product [Paramecium tetraurelia]|eukprot:XP_001462407.1 hypothetical protein (macronuclear) [Paramecium tetraurelia strain d4-2]
MYLENNRIGSIEEIEYLQNDIFPTLHTALAKLVEYVEKTEEVNKHKERLEQIKICDKIEKRRVERNRLKRELGSDFGSDSEGQAENLENKSINNDQYGKKIEQLIPIENEFQQQSQHLIDEIAMQEMKQEINHLLGQIQEDQGEEEAPQKHELEKLKLQLRLQREAMDFNPLIYLASLLRQLAK